MTTKEVKEMQVKQEAYIGGFDLFADGKEMASQGFSEIEIGSLLTVAALAHVEGKFREIYCSEADNNEFPQNVAWSLIPTRQVTVNLPSWGGYVCVSIGPGWFGWAVGCPLASAISEIWADASVSVYNQEDYD